MAKNHLKGARAYLSGPMDFVASRAKEKKFGWRNRVKQFLESYGVKVFDPWNKPEVRGLHEYGKEDLKSIEKRKQWNFNPSEEGIRARGECAASFWETLHIDLRMVDLSDFVVAYCPTNIYSVGTVHEIVVARQQCKPVLFVSPPVSFPTLNELESEISDSKKAKKLLDKLKTELPIKENPDGIPSLWYMPLVGSESFFDGFGFQNLKYLKKFKWEIGSDIDRIESDNPPNKPLLNFIELLSKGRFPERFNQTSSTLEPNDDWLLLDEILSR